VAYATADDVKMTFGRLNVEKWADADNDGNQSIINARIDWALLQAEARIDGRLKGSQYEIPFNPVPTVINDLCARLAAIILWELRGITDSDLEMDAMTGHRKY